MRLTGYTTATQQKSQSMSTVLKYCTNEFWLLCHIPLNTHAPLCRTVSKEGKPVCNSAYVILELR